MAYFECPSYDSTVLSLPTPSEASGAIARFNTDLTENLLSAVAEFSASQASGTPTPSAPIPIVGVDKVNITRTGKNLIEGTLDSAGISSSGVIGSSSSNNVIYARCKAGVKYSVTSSESNKVYAFYTSEPIKTSTSYNSSRSTTSSGVVTITAEIDGWLAVRVPNTDTTPQIEFGESVTTYEAPTVVTALINLGGTYYGGSVDAVTGKITLNHKKFTFDGSENWTATDTHIFRLVTTGNNWLPVNAANWQKGYFSNILRTDVRATGATSDKLPDHSFYITSQYIYVRFDEYDLTGLQTALNTTNLEIVAPVSTPETVYASNTAEIPTINGDNQVFADTGDVAVKFFETIKSAL